MRSLSIKLISWSILKKDMISERDYINIMETARDDGFAAGEAKGIATVAKAMLTSGMEISQISSLTGLTPEQIKKL